MKYSTLFAAVMAFSVTACGQKAAETAPPQVFAVSAPAATSPTGNPPLGSSMMPQNATELPKSMQAAAPAATLPAGHPPFGSSMMPQNATELPKSMQAAALPPLTQKAQVLSTINASQYTYLEVKQDNNTLWLATTTSAAKKGDTIQFDNGTVLSNFNSKILNRTFPSITFVGRVVVSN